MFKFLEDPTTLIVISIIMIAAVVILKIKSKPSKNKDENK